MEKKFESFVSQILFFSQIDRDGKERGFPAYIIDWSAFDKIACLGTAIF